MFYEKAQRCYMKKVYDFAQYVRSTVDCDKNAFKGRLDMTTISRYAEKAAVHCVLGL